MSAWFKTKAVTKVQNVTQPVGSSGTDPRRCTAAPCYKIKSLLRRILCLILCVSLLFSALAPKAEAVVAESAIAIGAIACLILMSVGVVFNPKTQEDLVAIGQNFQSYMYQWGTEAQKLDEVEEMFTGLHLIDPDDDGDWSPNKTKITLARTLLAGISLWCASVAMGLRKIEDPAGGSSLAYTVKVYKTTSATYEMFKNIEPVKSYLYSARDAGNALILGIHSDYLFGWFWNDESILCEGLWVNPYGHTGEGVFRSYSLSELTLIASCWAGTIVYNHTPVFFDQDIAAESPYWSSKTCMVLDWNTPAWNNVSGLRYLSHPAGAASWSQKTSTSICHSEIMPEGYSFANFYKAWDQSQIIWSESPLTIADPSIVGDYVDQLENGEISSDQLPIYDLDISQALAPGTPVLESIQTLGDWLTSNELTLEEYQTMTKGAADPVWEKSIEFGSSITYQQNAVADPIKVLASADDKGEILYEWHMYGQDADGNNFSALPIGEGPSIVPSTAESGTYYYYCKAMNRNLAGYYSHPIYTHTLTVTVTPTSVEPDPAPDPEPGVDPDPAPDPEPDVDPDLSGDIAAGEDFVGQLTDIIPNYSEGFAAALSDFASKFSYEGTEAVLTIPAIVTPEIPGPSGNEPLLKSHLLLAEQQIDFEESSKVIPEIVLLLVQCLLTVALILFCCKELYDVIAYILTLRREA